jgi:hypothetical protein
MSSRRRWVTGLGAALGLTAAGALGVGCGSGAPVIESVRFDGARAQNGYELDFMLSFADPDGDLGVGFLVVSLDGEPMSQLELAPILASARPPLALDARTGTITPIVALSGVLLDGDELTVRFELVDREENHSNTADVRLRARVVPGS